MTSQIFRRSPVRFATWLLLGLSGAGMVGSRTWADEVLPKASPASKYAKMAAHSPFAPPTAPVVTQAAPTPPPAPGWADSLTATMLVQDGNTYMVTVIDSQDLQKHLYLTSAADATEPMAVASIKWGATREEPPIITLRKGKEFAQVRYESGLSSLGTNNNLGGPPIPGARNPAPGTPVAPGIRPPPLTTTGPMNQGQPGNAIRRPVIHSQPAPTAVPARPLGNVPANGVRPNPAVQVDDDDDD